MTTFFILYWSAVLLGLWGARSYSGYHRQHVLRHRYAELHRSRVQRTEHTQSTLFPNS